MQKALTAKRIFTGEEFLQEHVVILAGREISAIVPLATVKPDLPVTDLGDGILAPGFIDVQVNGGGGVNFNDEPNEAGITRMVKAHRKFGTTGIFPTVITDRPEITRQAAQAISEIHGKLPEVLGIHIEGPFLDPARKGAHDPNLIRVLTASDMKWLKGLSCEQILLTVAPNKVSPADIEELAKSGIHVSLGHAEADANDVNEALAAGASGFTHLFNAMSQISPRQPGMVGSALLSTAFVGLIADGLHVDDDVLRLVFAVKDRRRIMLVTDAMATAASNVKHFALQGRQVDLKDGRLQLADGTLAGSNLTMDEAVRHCVNKTGLPLEDALRMASLNPAQFMGLGTKLGRVAPRYLASLVHLDDGLNVKNTWVEGE